MTVMSESRSRAHQINPAASEQTIGRRYVHRSALAEVFLTGVEAAGADAYGASAQFPRSHAYYGDRVARPATFDPVLVLEFARQAALAGAHAHYGVPFNHKFILTHQQLTVTAAAALAIGAEPAEVTAAVSTANRKEHGGVVSGLDYSMQIAVNGAAMGHAEIGLRFRSPESYTQLRLKNRAGAAPSDTERHSPERPGLPTRPYLVGRRDPGNVILVDASSAGDRSHARLSVPGGHPSLFDHKQDHLPGMVLVEAARQLTVLAVGEARGLAPTKLCIQSMSAEYSSFGELEPDTLLEAVVGDPVAADGVLLGLTAAAWFDGRIPVAVDVRQNENSIARIGFTVTRAEA